MEQFFAKTEHLHKFKDIFAAGKFLENNSINLNLKSYSLNFSTQDSVLYVITSNDDIHIPMILILQSNLIICQYSNAKGTLILILIVA